jgi:ABC-type amino acid transport substrate-binding protein
VAKLQSLEPGVLLVGSAFPDPPFDIAREGTATGFDMELMRAVCERLDMRLTSVRYEGADFNGIFDGLHAGRYDAVISGTTITPERERVALFSEPYLVSGQSLVVNVARTPHITSTDDLTDQVIGIQTGNTSDIVARKLHADGKIRDIRYYPYDGILDALDDLSAGRIGGFMKLLPVMRCLVKDRPDLAIVQEIPTNEKLGIAFAPGNPGLRDAVNGALDELHSAGTLRQLEQRWLG